MNAEKLALCRRTSLRASMFGHFIALPTSHSFPFLSISQIHSQPLNYEDFSAQPSLLKPLPSTSPSPTDNQHHQHQHHPDRQMPYGKVGFFDALLMDPNSTGDARKDARRAKQRREEFGITHEDLAGNPLYRYVSADAVRSATGNSRTSRSSSTHRHKHMERMESPERSRYVDDDASPPPSYSGAPPSYTSRRQSDAGGYRGSAGGYRSNASYTGHISDLYQEDPRPRPSNWDSATGSPVPWMSGSRSASFSESSRAPARSTYSSRPPLSASSHYNMPPPPQPAHRGRSPSMYGSQAPSYYESRGPPRDPSVIYPEPSSPGSGSEAPSRASYRHAAPRLIESRRSGGSSASTRRPSAASYEEPVAPGQPPRHDHPRSEASFASRSRAPASKSRVGGSSNDTVLPDDSISAVMERQYHEQQRQGHHRRH